MAIDQFLAPSEDLNPKTSTERGQGQIEGALYWKGLWVRFTPTGRWLQLFRSGRTRWQEGTKWLIPAYTRNGLDSMRVPINSPRTLNLEYVICYDDPNKERHVA